MIDAVPTLVQPAAYTPYTPEQTEAQFKQLLGVTRPGLAPKGVPQRPMTKSERFKVQLPCAHACMPHTSSVPARAPGRAGQAGGGEVGCCGG